MSCAAYLPTALCDATWSALTALILFLLIAAFARGYSGFGFSALLVASCSLLVDPALPVAVAMLLEISASVLQAVSVWRDVAWRRVGLLLLGAVIGIPIGVAVLALGQPALLRLIISAILLASCFALLAGYRFSRPVGTPGEIAVGGVSGLVNGATAMGGLPVALFLAASAEKPAVMRATFIAYFFFLDIPSGGMLAREGVLGAQTLATAALSLPILALGLWLGGRHFLGASEAQFRRHTLWLLIGLAGLGLAKAVMG
jgi:uncharacterized membrane protein YfcA